MASTRSFERCHGACETSDAMKYLAGPRHCCRPSGLACNAKPCRTYGPALLYTSGMVQRLFRLFREQRYGALFDACRRISNTTRADGSAKRMGNVLREMHFIGMIGGLSGHAPVSKDDVAKPVAHPSVVSINSISFSRAHKVNQKCQAACSNKVRSQILTRLFSHF